MYQFHWLPGGLVQPEQRQAFATLYSNHYGIWGPKGQNPGEHVSLTPRRLDDWLTKDAHVVWASLLGEVVGYAIAIRSKFPDGSSVAWVTQLVVHEEHRNLDIGKRLLFSIWKFTDHAAWGVLSANPYAIRALEKATRRRCSPMRIKVDLSRLLKVGRKQVAYVTQNSETVVNDSESRIDTEFFLDHSDLNAMLEKVQDEDHRWTLGPLPEGWEWFAFTFRDQPQIGINPQELAEMMAASDQITHEAFSRMKIVDGSHKWAHHAAYEVQFMIDLFNPSSHDEILDFGCGVGRHSLAFAEHGMKITSVDYVRTFIEHAQSEAREKNLIQLIDFEVADCRDVDLKKKFDFALCLYDVVGTYAEEIENLRLLKNLCAHLKPGAHVLLSVMNLELTKQRAKHFFSVAENADALLTLPASTIMEESGNIFDPEYYMLDRDTDIVYRKEQFKAGDAIPEELIVRDRRYTLSGMMMLCESVGLEVIWARRVHAGNWKESQPEESPKAKEILVFCVLVDRTAQQSLFAI